MIHRATLFSCAVLALFSSSVSAQIFGPTPSAAGVSTAPAVMSATQANNQYGIPLSADRGPWVVGDVQFVGGLSISPYALQDHVRARRGALYTPSDMANDVKELQSMPSVLSAKASVYGIPNQPVLDNYLSISVSTMMARIVYAIEEKSVLLPGMSSSSAAAKIPPLPPASVSGVVLTPTAYRGYGRFTGPGLGLDFNAAYYIGRLYGKNNLSTEHTNYIDRIGQWFLTVDGKMQIQSETFARPAAAVGAQGVLSFRDAPQPTLQAPGVSVNVSAKTTQTLSDSYFVLSKKFYGVRSSLGYMYGSAGNIFASMTEFLSPQSLQFLANKGAGVTATSNSVLFGSLMLLPKPQYPLAVEFMKPNGMVLDPWLLNFKIGYFLKLNFDLAYLHFQGGWDMLGLFQFRYTHFPRG